MGEGILKNKSMNFAIRIVNLYNFLNETKQERIMSKQILRSGTSVEPISGKGNLPSPQPTLYTNIPLLKRNVQKPYTGSNC